MNIIDVTMEDAAYLQMVCQDYRGCLNSARLQMAEPNFALKQTQTVCFFFFFLFLLVIYLFILNFDWLEIVSDCITESHLTRPCMFTS